MDYHPRGVDGHEGTNFAIALNAYRTARNLPPGGLDRAVLMRLKIEAGI